MAVSLTINIQVLRHKKHFLTGFDTYEFFDQTQQFKQFGVHSTFCSQNFWFLYIQTNLQHSIIFCILYLRSVSNRCHFLDSIKLHQYCNFIYIQQDTVTDSVSAYYFLHVLINRTIQEFVQLLWEVIEASITTQIVNDMKHVIQFKQLILYGITPYHSFTFSHAIYCNKDVSYESKIQMVKSNDQWHIWLSWSQITSSSTELQSIQPISSDSTYIWLELTSVIAIVAFDYYLQVIIIDSTCVIHWNQNTHDFLLIGLVFSSSSLEMRCHTTLSLNYFIYIWMIQFSTPFTSLGGYIVYHPQIMICQQFSMIFTIYQHQISI
jgi:hypothetical protein